MAQVDLKINALHTRPSCLINQSSVSGFIFHSNHVPNPTPTKMVAHEKGANVASLLPDLIGMHTQLFRNTTRLRFLNSVAFYRTLRPKCQNVTVANMAVAQRREHFGGECGRGLQIPALRKWRLIRPIRFGGGYSIFEFLQVAGQPCELFDVLTGRTRYI